MRPVKIIHIVGARPQFIKYFAVHEAMKGKNDLHRVVIEDVLVHTGQHYDYNMSKIFFDEFGIKKPDHHLGVGSGTHSEQTGQMMERVEDVLCKEKPDVVIVYGDTNSTLAGTLAAVKLNLPVAHVESGLRSFNLFMAEEINRILTDRLSSLLFCPGKEAVANLMKEGFVNVLNGGDLVGQSFFSAGGAKKNGLGERGKQMVINVGDVMYDVLALTLPRIEERSGIMKRLDLSEDGYYLLTLHRAGNTEQVENMEEMITFVNDISTGRQVIFPMHPRVKKVYRWCGVRFSPNIRIIDPVSYFDMIMLLRNCALVMTDSGGVQKEAFWLERPCITLRKETEWLETVRSGWNVLYSDYAGALAPPARPGNHYGDGKAARRIVETVMMMAAG